MHADTDPLMETVLVVDDHAQNLQLIDGQLSSAGYTVTCASSGEEALSLFARYTPDLILLDIMMPNLDGFETFRRLRQLPGGLETPIVFLTAAGDPETHRTALELGADDFLCKPINRTELLIRVRSLLRVRRLHNELRSGQEVLRTQRDRLLRVQKQKDELTAFVVHDLNNSLTTILLLAQQLEMMGSAGQAEAHDIALAAHSVHRMLMNLLDISRSEDGAMTPRLSLVELLTLANGACQRHRLRARQRQQSLELMTSGPVSVLADAELLGRLLDNLLDNAIKYAPPSTAIRIAAGLASDGRFAELRISDEGPGIPAEHRERVVSSPAPPPRAAPWPRPPTSRLTSELHLP